MGTCWARYCCTAILTCICTFFIVTGAITEAHAWATDSAMADDQPDYPGITKRFIDRKAKDGGVINMYYPETGNAAIDEAVLAVITKRLDNCEKCTPGKVFIKKDVIMLSQIKRSPFDTQTVNLKFRIADGTLKKIN